MDDLALHRMAHGHGELTPGDLREISMMKPTAEVAYLIIEALKDKKIDPDLFLIESIAVIENEEQLFYPALALRYDADPNLYVSSHLYGQIHILAHTFNSFSEDPNMLIQHKGNIYPEHHDKFSDVTELHTERLKNKRSYLLDQFVLMMLMGGSIPTKQTTKGKLQQTVRDYYITQGFEESILSDMDWVSKANPVLITFMAILLNKPSHLEDPRLRTATEQHMNAIVNAAISRSDHIIEHLTRTYLPRNVENIFVDHMSLDLMKIYLEKGYQVDYNTFNRLFSQIVKNRGTKIANVYEDMATYAVRSGYNPTEHQYAQSKLYTKRLSQTIEEQRKKPSWLRECESGGRFSSSVNHLLFSLGMDVSLDKSSLCEEIREILKKDFQTLVSHNEHERKTSLKSKGVPRNISDLDHPFDWCKYCTISYSDEKGDEWIFTSDMYESLLTSHRNPNNNDIFSQMFLDRLKFKKDMIDKYSNGFPVRYSQALSSLIEGRTILDEGKSCHMSSFNSHMQMSGVDPSSLKDLSNEKRQKILSELGLNVSVDEVPHQLRHDSFVKNLHTHMMSGKSSEVVDAVRRNL